MAKKHRKNNVNRTGYVETRASLNAKKRQARRELRGKTDEEVTNSEELSDAATLVARKPGNKTGPREQGLSKHEKGKKTYFGNGYVPPKKKEGPNIDGKARRAKRTKKDHARGTEVVEALLLHAKAEHKGKLTQEWQFRAGPDPKMPHATKENYRKLRRHFMNRTQYDVPELPKSAVSKSGDSVILQHAWKDKTVSIACMNNANKGSKGPDRQLNQQECEGIERITGYDPDTLVDDYHYGFEDDDVYELCDPA